MALTDYDFTKLIDKHESFKLKFGDLKIEDLFEWVKLKEEMVVMAINMDSELSEKELKLINRITVFETRQETKASLKFGKGISYHY